ELLERRRVLAARSNAVDLLRDRPYRVVEADQILDWRKRAQRVAPLGEAALDAGEVGGVCAGVPLAVDPLGKRADFGFERLDRLARHCLLDHQSDLGEVVAQRLDGACDAATPEPF